MLWRERRQNREAGRVQSCVGGIFNRVLREGQSESIIYISGGRGLHAVEIACAKGPEGGVLDVFEELHGS